MRRSSTGVSLALPAAAIGGWGYLHEPFHAVGFVAFLAPSLVAAVMAPAVLLSVETLPMLLIPPSLLIWHRKGHERTTIRVRLRYAVLAADRHRCCWCGNGSDLQIDHIRPWSRGGLNAFWNFMTLCGPCNRIKSNYWVARDGYVFYAAFEGHANARLAADILKFEQRHRWSPGRWIRAGWDLAA